MSDDLLSYLDVSGPEYAYLGHFRNIECLDAGHNVGASGADMYQQIAGGNIPDIKTGRNYAADAEPSQISAEDTAGMKPPADPAAPMGSLPSGKSSIVGPAVEGGIKSAGMDMLKALL